MSHYVSIRFHVNHLCLYVMRLLAFALLVLVGLLPACTPQENLETPPAAAVDGGEESPGARAAVEAVLAAQEQAIRRADMAALDRLWADDPGVHIFEQGGVDSSWVAYRDHHLGPELETLEDLDFRHEDMNVRVGSRLAAATGRYVLQAHHGDEAIESHGVFTTVLELREGTWKIVHTHLSRRPRR